MTTIATDGKTMAGDGRTSTNGTAASWSNVKVFRLTDGSLFGACGSSSWGQQLLDWLNGDQDSAPPKGDKNDGFMILKVDGTLWQGGEDGIATEIEAPFAIGSGYDLAIGAMDAGASAARAIEIASRRDGGTGGKITVLELRPIAKLEAA